jgi:hypothetical protein
MPGRSSRAWMMFANPFSATFPDPIWTAVPAVLPDPIVLPSLATDST